MIVPRESYRHSGLHPETKIALARMQMDQRVELTGAGRYYSSVVLEHLDRSVCMLVVEVDETWPDIANVSLKPFGSMGGASLEWDVVTIDPVPTSMVAPPKPRKRKPKQRKGGAPPA